MAAKKYSAGAIYLQVMPVFGDVQREIQREAEGWDRALGDQMEKSGEKAGQRAGRAAGKKMSEEFAKSDVFKGIEREAQAGIKGIEKALGDIDTSKMGDRVKREVRAMRDELASLSKTDIRVGDNFESMKARVADLRAHLKEMEKDSKLRLDMTGLPDVYRKLHQVENAINKVDSTIDLNLDTSKATREMGTFERSIKSAMTKAAGHIKGTANKEVRRLRDELEYLSRLRVGVDIGGAQLRREVAEITRELEHLGNTDPEIDVKWNAGKAFAELHKFEADVARLDGKDATVHVHANTAGASRNLNRVTRDGDAAANSFRSFNIVLLAAAGAGPALVPVLGAIAGGLLALGPAAAIGAAGISSVLIGFSGIGDAYSALSNQEAQSATTSQTAAKQRQSAAKAIENAQEAVADAERNAGRAAEDAAERVADARERSAEIIENALERQKDAQEAYRDSVLEVRSAEKSLREARREAAGMGDDIDDRIKDNQLARDQGVLDVFHATVTYDATMADGAATNADKEQARIDLERSRRRLEELREEQVRLAKEKKKWDKEGVNGTKQVQSAQDNLNSALDAQKEAYENVRDAAKAVDEARSDGAKMVADAIEDQNETLADNKRAIEDARDALADAKQGSVEVAEAVNAQQQAVDNAMDALGPAGRKFALFLFGMRDDFYAFRDDIQAAMLPSITAAIATFVGSESGSVLRDLFVMLAGGFGDFVEALSTSFQGPVWLEFFKTLHRIAPAIMDAYGGAFIAFLEGMASVMTTLAPYAVRFAEGFERLMDSFNAWAQSKEGQDAITGFMDHVAEIAPLVLEFIGALMGAFVNLARALAPYGEMILGLLTGFLDFVAQMDPQTLGAIVSSIIGLITASQVAYAFMNILLAGAALLASTIGVIIFAAVAIGLAVAWLWREHEGFRDFMTDAWERISKVVGEAWREHLKPALDDLWDALTELWHEVLEPLFAWLGPILIDFAEKWFPLMLESWSIMARSIAWTVREILIPTFKAIGRFFRWLWEDHLEPAFEDMEEDWDSLMRGMRWVWDHVLKPTFDVMREDVRKLKGAFQDAVDGIEKIWGGLKKVVAAPIMFTYALINEGLIDGFNKVAKWVGKDGFDHIKPPKWMQNLHTGGIIGRERDMAFATGGVMPGYTPGRDPHKFVSPTGGRLELSGGEAILRPEFTAAVGAGWVDQVNGAAMNGGIDGVKRALGLTQSFAKGGIVFPVPGGYVNRSSYNLGHDGMDINHPNDASGRVPILSATQGRVTSTGYSRGYGNAVFVATPYGELVYGHALDGSVRVAPGQPVSPGQWLANIGNTGRSSGPHLHFGFPGGTFYGAEALLGGAADAGFDWKGAQAKSGKGPSIPGWIKGLIKNPISTIKGWVTDKWSDASDLVRSSPAFDIVKHVPSKLADGFKDKVMGIMPDWAKGLAGAADKVGDTIKGAADVVSGGVSAGASVVGDKLGFANGGVLPYNGTMMYDSGGFLPPGITSVVNLTGKPEPVLTQEQYSRLGIDGRDGITYAPTFQGSDLTAEDVANDLDRAFRRIGRRGKYGGASS